MTVEDDARDPARGRRERAAPGARPDLVLVTDAIRLHGRALPDVVRAAVDGGVTIVQLRNTSASHRELLRVGGELRRAIDDRARFFVNGDAEVARALHADGLHLPEAGESVVRARAIVGDAMLISRAVHSVEAAIRAGREGANIVQAGTLFATSSHPRARTLGTEGLRAICDAVHLPVIAIGGITANTAPDALAAGAAGVAVIGAIFDASDPAAAASELRSALDVRVVAR